MQKKNDLSSDAFTSKKGGGRRVPKYWGVTNFFSLGWLGERERVLQEKKKLEAKLVAV